VKNREGKPEVGESYLIARRETWRLVASFSQAHKQQRRRSGQV